MPIGRKGSRVRRGCHQKRPAGRSKNIWLCSTMRPSALRPMSCPSSSHRPIRQAEVLAAKRMIERSIDRFDLYPARLLGDSAYGSAEMLGWLVYEHGIEPHVTVFDKSTRQDGTFSRDDFTYDHNGDVYSCPAGKMLTTTGSRVNDGATLRYRASKYDCEACRLKPRCCPKEPARYVPRSIYEGARDTCRS